MLPVGGRQVAGPLHSIKSIGISVIHFETLIAYFFAEVHNEPKENEMPDS